MSIKIIKRKKEFNMCMGYAYKAAKKMKEYFDRTYPQICVKQPNGEFFILLNQKYYKSLLRFKECLEFSDYFEEFENSEYDSIELYFLAIVGSSIKDNGMAQIPEFKGITVEELENGTGKFTINSTYAQRIFHFFLDHAVELQDIDLQVDPEKERQFYGQTYDELLAGKTNTSNTIILPPATKEESSVIPAEGSPQKYSINDVIYKILNEFFKEYTDKIHPDFLIPIVRESIPASKSIDPNQKLLGPEVVNEVINAFKNSDYIKEAKKDLDVYMTSIIDSASKANKDLKTLLNPKVIDVPAEETTDKPVQDSETKDTTTEESKGTQVISSTTLTPEDLQKPVSQPVVQTQQGGNKVNSVEVMTTVKELILLMNPFDEYDEHLLVPIIDRYLNGIYSNIANDINSNEYNKLDEKSKIDYIKSLLSRSEEYDKLITNLLEIVKVADRKFKDDGGPQLLEHRQNQLTLEKFKAVPQCSNIVDMVERNGQQVYRMKVIEDYDKNTLYFLSPSHIYHFIPTAIQAIFTYGIKAPFVHIVSGLKYLNTGWLEGDAYYRNIVQLFNLLFNEDKDLYHYVYTTADGVMIKGSNDNILPYLERYYKYMESQYLINNRYSEDFKNCIFDEMDKNLRKLTKECFYRLLNEPAKVLNHINKYVITVGEAIAAKVNEIPGLDGVLTSLYGLLCTNGYDETESYKKMIVNLDAQFKYLNQANCDVAENHTNDLLSSLSNAKSLLTDILAKNGIAVDEDELEKYAEEQLPKYKEEYENKINNHIQFKDTVVEPQRFNIDIDQFNRNTNFLSNEDRELTRKKICEMFNNPQFANAVSSYGLKLNPFKIFNVFSPTHFILKATAVGNTRYAVTVNFNKDGSCKISLLESK